MAEMRDLLSWIRERRRAFSEHLLRMGDDSTSKVARENPIHPNHLADHLSSSRNARRQVPKRQFLKQAANLMQVEKEE